MFRRAGVRHVAGESCLSDFREKVALIRSAGNRVGRHTAIKMAQAGIRVFLTDKELAPLMETVEIIQASGGQASAATFYVSSVSDAEAMVNAVLDEFGALHFAVNNIAGYAEYCRLHEIDEHHWDSVIDAALKSIWLGMKHQIPAIKASGGGAIVNVASMAGVNASPGISAFAAAAASVISLTRSAADEVASEGLRVNAISPGGICTEPLMQLIETESGLAAHLDAEKRRGHLATPDQVADCIVYLCSDDASLLNGENLLILGNETLSDTVDRHAALARQH